MKGKFNIRVVCATSDVQRILSLRVPAGTVARDALALSGIAALFPEIDPARAALGVYGESVADNYVMQEGDRLEVYRALQNDPRDQRRKLAATGKTMGQADDGSA